MGENDAEILRQHGTDKLGITHEAGGIEIQRGGEYVYAYGHDYAA